MTKHHTISAVQSWKWWLIGTGYSIPRCKVAASIVRTTDFGPAVCSQACATPQSTTLGLHPIIHIPNYMDHYSFTDPWGMDGWVGHVGWSIADVWPTKWSSVQLAGKVFRPRPAFYPLCYTANCNLPSCCKALFLSVICVVQRILWMWVISER